MFLQFRGVHDLSHGTFHNKRGWKKILLISEAFLAIYLSGYLCVRKLRHRQTDAQTDTLNARKAFHHVILTATDRFSELLISNLYFLLLFRQQKQRKFFSRFRILITLAGCQQIFPCFLNNYCIDYQFSHVAYSHLT